MLLGLAIVAGATMIVASHFLGPRRPTDVKERPYESGMPPLGSAHERFSEVLSRRGAVHSVRHRNRISHPLGDHFPGRWRSKLRFDGIPPRGNADLPADLVRWVYLRLEARRFPMGLSA